MNVVPPRDAQASGRRIRFGVGTKLYLAVSGAVVFTLAASLVAWVSFGQIAEIQRRITDQSIPAMANALLLAQQSTAIASIAPKLGGVASQDERRQVVAELNAEYGLLIQATQGLAQDSPDVTALAEIRGRVDELADTLEQLDRSVGRRLDLAARLDLGGRAAAQAHRRLTDALAPLLDDANFYLATGYRTLADRVPATLAQRARPEAILAYEAMTQVEADGNLMGGLLAEAVNTPQAEFLLPLRERFVASAGRVEHALGLLDDTPGAADLRSITDDLVSLGRGDGDIFRLRRAVLANRQSELQLLETSREIAAAMSLVVGQVVVQSEDAAAAAAAASTAAIATGQRLLLVLNVVAIAGAFLIAWLYVGRGLLRRLTGLANTMRKMADGDLTVPVDRRGGDEVTDMADALEVFRQHALEVQRLNLVEKLAEEVNEKNAALEATLDKLRAAQNQIVMQEKMASLG